MVEGTLTPSRSVLLSTELLQGQADSVDLRLPLNPGTFEDTVVVLQFEEPESGRWTAELDLETLAQHTVLSLDPGEVIEVPLSVHALRGLVSQGGAWGITVELACDSLDEQMREGLCAAP